MEKLKQVAFEVIKEEKLPEPIEIKFRATVSGTAKRRGVCVRYHLNDEFKLIINTTKTRWFEDDEGKYTDKNTGKRFRKATIGETLTENEIKNTLAHEIAHLKFWNHDAKHTSYSLYILNKINEKLANIV